MDRVRYLSLPQAGRLTILVAQHKAIFEAIAKKRPEQAAERMTTHLQEVLRAVRKLSVERPHLFDV
jgi:DNA-binding FadR family transcriptional regulator